MLVSPPRLAGVGAALLVALSASATPAPQPTTIVHPTGEFPTDVENVQAAVDAGGIVLHAATDAGGAPTAFDFGPADASGGTVVLENDVVIVGDPDGTVIEGGYVPFLGVEAAQTRIEGLTFDGPLVSAAVFVRSTGAEFVGNHVTGVVGAPLWFGLTEGRGVKFLGNSDPDGAITGHVLVADNRFDDMGADLSEAIVFDAVAADVTVAGNEVHDVASGGVLAIQAGGRVEITRNVIVPGTTSGFAFGNAMQLIGADGGSYVVTHNRIACENPWADAILVVANEDVLGYGAVTDLVVSDNDVTYHGDYGAISLLGEISGATVSGNRIRGAGLYALGLVPLFPGELAASNTFVGNNLTGFDATLADTLIFSHAEDTVLVGNGGTVLDLAADSEITGEGPVRLEGGLTAPSAERARARWW